MEEHKGIHVWRWRGLVLWVVCMTLAVVYFGSENRHRVSDIQTSRIVLATISCKDQNARNADTKAFIDREIAKQVTKLKKLHATKAQITNAQHGGDIFKKLIDAIIPKRDCASYVPKSFQ